MYVVLTKPDGSTITKGPYTSYQEGTIFLTYTPDTPGEWSAKLTWAGDYQNEGCESPPFKFTVQQEPAPKLPDVPLPTSYWERPVNAENHLWASILGDWMRSEYTAGGYNATGSSFNPYSKAPETAHILWKHPTIFGGIIGGDFGAARFSIYQTSVYPITICGRVYYMLENEIHVLDMRTGEEIMKWMARKGTTGTIQAYYAATIEPVIAYDNIEDRPQSQWHAYLWVWNSTNMMRYDPFTGVLLWNLKPPSGTTFGKTLFVSREGFAYTEMGGRMPPPWGTTNTLVCWDLWQGRRDPTFLTYSDQNFTAKIIWAKTKPAGASLRLISGDVIILSGMNYTIPTTSILAAMSTKTGEILWRKSLPQLFLEQGAAGFGIVAWPDSASRCWYAYDLHTGNQVWVSEPAEYPWGAFWAYTQGAAYGMIYGLCYDGHVYAFDAKTGKTVWKFYCGDNFETPYNTLPFWISPAIADGKIYVGNGEHTMGDPFTKGCKLYCLNAYTGEKIWSISFGGAGEKAIADGKLIVGNEQDNQLYCFDKGQTVTTIEVSSKIVTRGSTVLIEGSVVDKSPAQLGTPAVADDDMSPWMEYLHMQKPMPQTVKGVTVELYAIAEDGSTTKIGTANTDPLNCGIFKILWTPPREGTYTITAVFPGSKSYWSSTASTAIGVVAAPPAGPAPATAEQAEKVQSTVQSAVEALQPWNIALTVLVAIAIVIGIINLYALRKRK